MTPAYTAVVVGALDRRRRQQMDDLLLVASAAVSVAVGWPEGRDFPLSTDDLFEER
jgi:hypothetical protein